MLKTKQDIINKIHLIISVCIVVPVAFVYGFKPELSFDMFLETVEKDGHTIPRFAYLGAAD